MDGMRAETTFLIEWDTMWSDISFDSFNIASPKLGPVTSHFISRSPQDMKTWNSSVVMVGAMVVVVAVSIFQMVDGGGLVMVGVVAVVF